MFARRCAFVPSALVLIAARAGAVPDGFDLGDGHKGPLNVSAGSVVINRHTALAGAAATSATSITVSNGALFMAGDLVMVWRTTGLSTAPASGDPAPVDLVSIGLGAFELARVTGIAGNVLQLGGPLRGTFPAAGTQVVTVPEYTTVTVAAGASVAAAPWDGLNGGIVVLLATGAVDNSGTITAYGAGFRAGPVVIDATAAKGCTLLDYPDARGGRKGEGLYPVGFAPSQAGMGNLANGAGGGDCFNAGGGGGGNGGQGGRGGFTHSGLDGSRQVGGLGGARLMGSVLDALTLGGGGGGGHEDTSAQGTAGGAGGGVVFVRAQSLTGTGTVSAAGQSALDSGIDGAGGGGAGGTLHMRLRVGAACQAATAAGGNGGNHNGASADRGPGGGGAGGRALMQTATPACPVVAGAGLAGLSRGVTTYGATPTSTTDPTVAGVNETPPPGGFLRPTTPSLTFPAAAASIATRTPTYQGTADPAGLVELKVDAALQGSVIAGAGGNWSMTPSSPLAEGSHLATATAIRYGAISAPSPTVTFVVDVTAPPAPTITSPANGTTVPSSTPTIAGTAEPDAAVRIAIDALPRIATTAAAGGAFSATSPALADGPHKATATAWDAAGNASGISAPVDFTVQGSPPPPPTIDSPLEGATVGARPNVSGTTAPATSVAVQIDGAAAEPAAVSAGRFTYAPASDLAPGPHGAVAASTDGFQRSSAPSVRRNFVVAGPDAGAADAAVPDGGAADAEIADAGAPDSAVVDAGVADAGRVEGDDAGALASDASDDAGALAGDASDDGGGAGRSLYACGCSAPGVDSALAAGVLAAACRPARRRRRSPAPVRALRDGPGP